MGSDVIREYIIISGAKIIIIIETLIDLGQKEYCLRKQHNKVYWRIAKKGVILHPVSRDDYIRYSLG